MAEILYTFDDPPSERDIERAIKCLGDGGLIAYPTDLNWAVGCDAKNVKAMEKMKRLKPNHPKDQPFGFICSSISMISEVAIVSNVAYRYLKKAFPGPYTVLLPRSKTLPRQFKDKRKVVGVRVPESPLLLLLVEKFGYPLVTTSFPSLAPEGEDFIAPTWGYQIEESFGHQLDLILDLGRESAFLETTVVDFSEDEPDVIREGVGDPDIFGIS